MDFKRCVSTYKIVDRHFHQLNHTLWGREMRKEIRLVPPPTSACILSDRWSFHQIGSDQIGIIVGGGNCWSESVWFLASEWDCFVQLSLALSLPIYLIKLQFRVNQWILNLQDWTSDDASTNKLKVEKTCRQATWTYELKIESNIGVRFSLRCLDRCNDRLAMKNVAFIE